MAATGRPRKDAFEYWALEATSGHIRVNDAMVCDS